MIKHVKGDIFQSDADVILHQVNCQGALLGIAQLVQADKNTIVVNIFAQKNFGYDGKCYTDYSALRKGLETVRDNNKEDCIAIPYLMGCHRGGGDWNIVSSMIEEILSDCDVTLYEYNGG